MSAQHVLVDLVAVGNTGGRMGFGLTEDTNPAAMTCEGTRASWDNGTDVGAVGGVSTDPIGGVTAEQLIGADRVADGSLPDLGAL